MFSKKGTQFHKRSGRLFFAAMIGTTLSSLVLAVVHPSYFLWCIGVFSFYQNFVGFRAVRRKSLRPEWRDYLVLSISVVNTVMMLVVLHPVLFVFGLISLMNVSRQVLTYRKLRTQEEGAKDWLRMHIGMMMGAFIATVTAFIVVNSDRFISMQWQANVVWFIPTAILLPLMAFWMKKYTGEKRRLN
jgi:hypothetical protein